MIFAKKQAYDRLIVGLGNPGSKYDNTRHNVGFMALDLLAEKKGFNFNKNKMDALIGECKIGDERILVIKPQTFMNNSGVAVSKIAKFYKIPAEKIIVLCDDISLDVGKIRLRRKGSHGGHNGLRSIVSLLGTDGFSRIKIGVGAKPHPEYDLADWVLSKFTKSENEVLQKAIGNTVLALEETVVSGIDSAMNKYTS